MAKEKISGRSFDQPKTKRQPPDGGDAAALSLRRDDAYGQIKHSIITGELRSGEYINELQLSAALKIGKTPVHQALDRLMVEGFVETIPHKGVIVKSVSINEALQISEVRLINETYCARIAAERADKDDIARLEAVLTNAKNWTRERNVEQMMLADREFHLLIAAAARNATVSTLLKNLHERSLRFWFISLHAPGQFERVEGEHQSIFTAIQKRDPDAAEHAMRLHIESFRDNLTRLL